VEKLNLSNNDPLLHFPEEASTISILSELKTDVEKRQLFDRNLIYFKFANTLCKLTPRLKPEIYREICCIMCLIRNCAKLRKISESKEALDCFEEFILYIKDSIAYGGLFHLTFCNSLQWDFFIEGSLNKMLSSLLKLIFF